MADEWYYAQRGVRTGPVSIERLRQLAGAGQLRPEDLVWKEGMAAWSAASEIDGIFSYFGWASPPPAVPAAPAGQSDLAAGPPPAEASPFRQTVTFGQGSSMT